MKFSKLASLIAKQEGKKHHASIGDIREILKIIVDIESKDPGCVSIELLKLSIKKRKRK